MLYGERKWSENEVSEGVLEQLIERASISSYGRANDRRHFTARASASSIVPPYNVVMDIQ